VTQTSERTSPVLTPRLRTTARRWLFWAVMALVVLLVAAVVLASAGSTRDAAPLDPESPAPTGAMAVAEVLRDQGVDVSVVRSLDDARQAVDDGSTTTLVIYDAALYLEDSKLQDAVRLTDTVILMDPVFSELQAVAPELGQAGNTSEVLDADCSLPPVERAGSVSGGAAGYRVVDEGVQAVTCLGSGDGVYSLVELPRDDGRLIVLGAVRALTNELVIEEGNAAFALGLLGENENLVWYLPSFDDVDADVSLPDLTPPWVTPVILLLFVTALTAAIWRGRRLGPLVVENLPVTVKSSETMLGRARLYSRSSSRLRALDSLRIGSIQRLAALCGLPRVATVDEVVAAVAGLTGAQVADIRRLLVDAEPQTDRDLIAYSDALLTLERDVTKALRP